MLNQWLVCVFWKPMGHGVCPVSSSADDESENRKRHDCIGVGFNKRMYLVLNSVIYTQLETDRGSRQSLIQLPPHPHTETHSISSSTPSPPTRPLVKGLSPDGRLLGRPCFTLLPHARTHTHTQNSCSPTFQGHKRVL